MRATSTSSRFRFRYHAVLLALCFVIVCDAQAQTTASDDRKLRMLQARLQKPDLGVSGSFTFSPLAVTSTNQAPRYLSALTLQHTNLQTQEQPLCYAVDDLAFFCRLEVKIEKATKMPVRFRLGDVQQVDYLEGKFSGWRYGY